MAKLKSDRLKYNEKAVEIVNNLSLEEKVYLMSGNMDVSADLAKLKEDPLLNHYNHYAYPAGGTEKYGVEPILFVDGPRGAVCGVGKNTCFPVSMLRGATFNTRLEEEIGRAIGREVRAYGGNLFGGVCINLPYHPGWGRSQETYGEESFQIGQMGAALTRGVQEEDVIACVKHYAFNQMENSRFDVDVSCDKRTEREVFLPHFKDCIDAGAASIMSSYNKYKSVYAGHNKYLLNEVLKTEWDFDGFVISDFVWGVKDTVEAANGGQDVEMCATNYFGDKLVKAVQDGFVSEENINNAALRIVRTMLAFTDNQKVYDESVLASKEHTDLAYRAAIEGITLIKNDNNNLPIKSDKVEKVLVLGKLSDAPNIGDYGSSRVYPPYVVTILEGIRKKCKNIEVVYNNGENQDYAMELVDGVDHVIFVVGYNHADEGEYVSKKQHDNYLGDRGGDRISIGLHDSDIRLIKAVAPLNKNSTVVLIGGNQIMMTGWEKTVSSVVMAYYPGMEGGNAVADILFGDENPSGKLPFVVPVSESDLPYVEWFTNRQYYEYYHGYARLDKNNVKPLYHYGHGLSYTKFNISDSKVERQGDELVIKCKVKNIGNVKGKEVVQVYIGFENSKIDRPVKLLRGFEKVELKPGEEKEVTINVNIDKLNWFNPVVDSWELEAMNYNVYVGNNANIETLLKNTIYIG